MSHIKQKVEQQSESFENMRDSTWSHAHDTVQSFQNEPLFIESLDQYGADSSDNTTMEYADALSRYAEDYCAAYELPQDEAEQILLVANAPYLSHVQEQLTYYENERKHRRLDDDEWDYYNKSLKAYAVWYNQKLSDYIYTNPQTNLSDVTHTLIDTAIDHFPRKEHLVQQQISAITKGARKEAITRQLLDLTPIQYAAGTPEDDLRGGDVVIIYKDKRIKVDVKSSLDSIAHIHGSYDEIEKSNKMYATIHNKHDKYGSIIIFPGFTDQELGDACYLEPEIAKQRATVLMVQLQRACNELEL